MSFATLAAHLHACAQRQRGVVKITTGSKAVDAILGGGVETRSLTELYGEFRCGLSHRERGAGLVRHARTDAVPFFNGGIVCPPPPPRAGAARRRSA